MLPPGEIAETQPIALAAFSPLRHAPGMNNNDLDNYKMPKLGREIARFFVNIARAVKASVPSRLGERATRAKAFMRRHYLAPIFIIALVLFVPWVMLLMEVGASLFEQVRAPIETDPDAKRAQFYAMGLTVTGIGALLAPPFILIKAWVNERTATTAEQGHITERMTKAIEQLGAEKTVYRAGEANTEPNIEVRLGAIYALERIAQDSERDHIPIMETLCAYLRQNANESSVKQFELKPIADGDWKHPWEATPEQLREVFASWIKNIGKPKPPRADISAILRVFERRSNERRSLEASANPEFQIDLTRANFQGLDFTNSELIDVLAVASQLDGASFDGSWCIQGNFRHASMIGASLIDAEFEDSNLRAANLSYADLRLTNFTNADIWHGILQFSDLRSVNFGNANLDGCNLSLANCRAANFTTARTLSQQQVNSMYGDSKTRLPPALERPLHWADGDFVDIYWKDPAYENWIARGAPPGKPIED